MIPTDVPKVTMILETMEQHESILADFYAACAETWSEEGSFWLELAEAEKTHRENIRRMIAILQKKFPYFSLGRPFNLVALNTAIAGIKENIRRLKAGELNQAKALFLARDIEQSLLESKYAEIVTTNDLEYQTLLSDILTQTGMHKNMIQGKIANGGSA
ncbi:MAG: hypothetical protein HY742_06175 [Deltaproteobacteria bacterium]|nr:hypothetical protein [Deltaproteobacteria bacterium]